MDTINATVCFNERTNQHFKQAFRRIEELPEVGDIFKGEEVVKIDCVSDYPMWHANNYSGWADENDFYAISTRDEHADEDMADTIHYVFIPKEDPEMDVDGVAAEAKAAYEEYLINLHHNIETMPADERRWYDERMDHPFAYDMFTDWYFDHVDTTSDIWDRLNCTWDAAMDYIRYDDECQDLCEEVYDRIAKRWED